MQLEAEREKILQRHETWIAAQERLDSLEAWCMDVAARLRGFTYQEKRLALDALGVAVRVYDTSHDPRYVIEAHIPLDEEVFKCTKSRC